MECSQALLVSKWGSSTWDKSARFCHWSNFLQHVTAISHPVIQAFGDFHPSQHVPAFNWTQFQLSSRHWPAAKNGPELFLDEDSSTANCCRPKLRGYRVPSIKSEEWCNKYAIIPFSNSHKFSSSNLKAHNPTIPTIYQPYPIHLIFDHWMLIDELLTATRSFSVRLLWCSLPLGCGQRFASAVKRSKRCQNSTTARPAAQ